jgi:hypothetical protein
MALTKAKLIELFDAGDLDDYLTASSPLDAYPVGSIYMSTASTSPATLFGGTWVAWGAGRVPVGVDAAQVEFDAVEETGGEKTHTLTVAELASHNHTMNIAGNGGLYLVGGATPQEGLLGSGTNYVTALDTRSTASNGSGAAHNNLQPYITCYMWKRTA